MLNFRSQLLTLSLIACAAFSSAVASAEPVAQPVVQIIDTQIFKIENPTAAGAPYTVLSTADGRVYTVPASDAALVKQLTGFAKTRTTVHLNVFKDEVVYVTALNPLDAKGYSDPLIKMSADEINSQVEGTGPLLRNNFDNQDIAAPLSAPVVAPAIPTPAAIAEFRAKQGYEPTILPSMDAAQELFKNVLRDLDHGSQCHERAMVWTHDMFVNRGIKSFKVMMFYTPEFRNEFKHKSSPLGGLFGDSVTIYKWWYHTAPMVYVKDTEGYKEVVLDREFMDKAVTLDDWSYFFLHDEMRGNGANIPYSNVSSRELTRAETHCKVLSNFREYAIPALRNLTAGANCMVRKYPMYYMQPADVAMMDCKVGADGKPNSVVDPDYTRGLTGGKGASVLDRKINGGKDYYYNCNQVLLSDFPKAALEIAYKSASQRK